MKAFRWLLTTLPSLILLTPLTLGAGCSDPSPEVETKAALTTQPNIVFILTDDLNLEVFNNSRLPRLKALLGDQGTTFDRSLVSISLCCPSRAATLRGQYAHNSGIFS